MLQNADFEVALKGWTIFYKKGLPVPHDPENQVGYSVPEVVAIKREPPFLNPPRIYEGNRAVKLFTFWKIHDAGVYQVVDATPGARYTFSAYAHAWSSQDDNPATSIIDENFTFQVGIDPLGGVDPWADTVIWGTGEHIYNTYKQISPVTAIAASSLITVFVRSTVKWPYKHCDAYIDKAELVQEAPEVSYDRIVRMADPTIHTPQQLDDIYQVGREELQTVTPSWNDAIQVTRPAEWFTNTVHTGPMDTALRQGYIDWAAARDPKTVLVFDELKVHDVRDQLVTNPRSPWHPWKTRELYEITHIFVHHSAGALSSSLDTVKAIAASHTSPTGKFRPGICYTYAIGADGTKWYVSSIENVVFAQGSDSFPGDENRFGLGIVLLGNFTGGKEPPAAQMKALEEMIEFVNKRVGRTLKVWGHKDVINTQCPGDSWPWRAGWGRSTQYSLRPGHNDSVWSLHWVPTTHAGVENFVRSVKPTLMKFVADCSPIPLVRTWSPDTLISYRIVDDALDVHNPAQAAAFVQRYITELRPHLVAGKPIYIYSINEKIECGHHVQNLACSKWDTAFLNAIEASGEPIRGVVFTAPVGNPHATPGDLEMFLPLVDKVVRNRHLLGPHCYYPTLPGNTTIYQTVWDYHGGRFALFDSYFRSKGLHPNYVLGEAGPCGATIGPNNDIYYNSGAGWKFGGSVERCRDEVNWSEQWYRRWNRNHGDRVLSACFYSSGGYGWNSFQLVGGDLDIITGVLSG